MTNDEAINTLKNTAWLGSEEQAEKVSEAVRMAVEALKTQLPKEDTTSDCISRQEAIRIASGYCHFANVAKELEKLPSVQPVDKDINVSCKDAIDRQVAIDALEKVAELFPWRVPGKSDTYDSYNEAWNDAIGRAEMEIEKLPSVQPEPHWIPCSKRLPERGEDVLVTRDYDGREDNNKSCRYVEVASCYGEDEDITWNSFSDEYKMHPKNHHVIAWMPLPEPYEERRER